MDDNHILFLAAQIRGAAAHQKTTLTLSTDTLAFLLSSFDLIEEQPPSPSTTFQLKTPNLRAEILRDLQFLNNYIQRSKALKLYSTSNDLIEIDITRFRNVQMLEFCKVDVKSVRGLRGLRPQLRRLRCQKTSNCLKEILSDCGGDQTHPYCWDELKEASFVGNLIMDIDQSLECAPWLHTLDLSHNEITDIEGLSCLHNLKSLNLAFNKLEVVAPLRGQICTRLQNLVLKNNFIEDISGLKGLANLTVLDLSNNCLVEHKLLIPLAHLAALQFLNLSNNPLSFHPLHRSKSASYLHGNASSSRFLLDNVALTNHEKRLVGSYFPLQSSSLMTESMTSTGDKGKKVRHVVIEEEGVEVEDDPQVRSVTPRPYLETKRQVEDLHEKFGESWLNSQSGLLDVLGLEGSSLPLSASPYEADFTIYSGHIPPIGPPDEEVPPNAEDLNEEYSKVDETPDVSFDEPDLEEESIYLATVQHEAEPIFLVVTQTHLSERECSTSLERDKWHLESITGCEVIGDSVKVDFETMRKDRKQRVYVFEEEIQEFVRCLERKRDARGPKKQTQDQLQCMKCSSVFAKKNGLFVEEDVRCPSCDSTLVVEHV